VTAPRTVTRGRAFSRALRFAGPAVRRPRGSRGRVVRRPRGSPAPGFAGPCGSPAPGFAGPGDPGSHGLPPRRPLGLRLLAPIPSGSAFPRAPPSHADPSGSAFPRRFPRARPSRAVSLGLGLPAGSAFPRRFRHLCIQELVFVSVSSDKRPGTGWRNGRRTSSPSRARPRPTVVSEGAVGATTIPPMLAWQERRRGSAWAGTSGSGGRGQERRRGSAWAGTPARVSPGRTAGAGIRGVVFSGGNSGRGRGVVTRGTGTPTEVPTRPVGEAGT